MKRRDLGHPKPIANISIGTRMSSRVEYWLSNLVRNSDFRWFIRQKCCLYVRRLKTNKKKRSQTDIHSLRASFTLENPDELPPEACGTPDFPVLLTRTAADPAVAAAVPGTPGGSANELVLGRPMPLISLWKCQLVLFSTVCDRACIKNNYNRLHVGRTPRFATTIAAGFARLIAVAN